MSVELPLPRLPSALRIEYKGFKNVADRREYLLVLCRPEGVAEFRFSIGIAAFKAGRVRLQDAPDLCYQKLLHAVAAGAPTSGEVIHIEDAELVSYRAEHTAVPKRRSSPTPSTTAAEPAIPRPAFVPRRTVTPPKPTAPPHASPAFDEGQRVHHAVFGDGVTSLSSGRHTAVCFDEHGSKTFLTSLLQLDVLSEPRTWETSPRGKNRLRKG